MGKSVSEIPTATTLIRPKVENERQKMFNVSFKINGRSVPLDRIGDELAKEMKKEASAEISRHVESIRCPVHGQSARVSVIGRDGPFQVQGCCGELVAEVQRQLGGSGTEEAI